MKEIYIRAKAVNGTYVYVPIGTDNTYGTILIDNESLKYYNDTNGKTKLRVNGAALVDENTLTSYTDNDGKTKLKVNSAKLVGNDTLYAVDNKLYVNVDLVSRLANDEIWEKLNKKLDKTAVVHNIGGDTTKVMSQYGVTLQLTNKLDKTEAKENFASLVNGKVPASQLPSYVDDVVEYDNKSAFPATGETGKIYVDKSTNLTYRWSGTTYIQVGGGDLNVVQTTGNSETDVMSQKAVTDNFDQKLDKSAVKGYGGTSATDVMSQKVVTLMLISKLSRPSAAPDSESFVAIKQSPDGVNTTVRYIPISATLDKPNVVQTTGNSETDVMSQKAATDNFARLVDGKVPESQLPSYVDDVLEYDSKSAFPATGEEGKIYVDKSTNLTYRWSGSTYIQVGGGDLALENGTGDVLIQTTNSNQSFKVMTDGRAKVQSGPIEGDDVVRKIEFDTKLDSSEFSVLTQSQVDLLF